MLLKKKGIATYLLALIGVSFAMTVLFLIIVSSIYDTENVGCESIDFDVSGLCLKSTGVELAIANRGDIPMKFMVNNDMSTYDEIVVGERKIKHFDLGDVNKVTITPFLVQREKTFLCKSKNYKFEKNLITNNC